MSKSESESKRKSAAAKNAEPARHQPRDAELPDEAHDEAVGGLGGIGKALGGVIKQVEPALGPAPKQD
jgi:hypothetical protein